ncbi:MAG: PAS domain-containing sensor histidine kinase [Bacteroidota bacterium]
MNSKLYDTKPVTDFVGNMNNIQDLSADSKFLLNTLNSINEAISITDLTGVVVYVNRAFLQTYGYEYSELIGKSIEIVSADDNDELQKNIRQSTIKESWQGRLINKRKDGSFFPIELSCSQIRNDDDELVGLLGIARDITDQVIAEEKLLEAKSKYHSLFKELKDAVYESTPEGKFVELNPAGMELFGINSLEELMNIDIAKEMYLHSGERENFKKVLEENGFVKNYQIDIRKRTGDVITVLETSLAIKNQEGKTIAYRGILRDITELKKNEAKMKQMLEKIRYVNEALTKSEEKLRITNGAKDRLFSIIAHDLRSPFNSLLNFSEFLVEDIDNLEKDEIRLFSEKIHEAAKSVFALLENLLQWSRLQSGKIPFEPASFNMHYKINQAIKLLSNNAANKKINVINDTNPSSIVFADEDMLFIIIENLLTNAIKFTRENGIIIFKSSICDNLIEFSINDNGVGIAEEDIPKLFRLDTHHTTYGTNEEKGTGLGLVICKEMIERNKGKISVASRPNEGTTFTFTLPKA